MCCDIKVDFKLWDEHRYTMSTHYVLWYQTIFVKNAPFCHFVRGSCIFSLLQFCQKPCKIQFCHFCESKMLKVFFFFTFSILWMRFWVADLQTIFVKNARFCHFVRGPWIVYFFSLLQFCQKCSILSFCERSCGFFFASSILSKKCSILSFSERAGYFFSHFNIVKNGPFCHYWKVDFKLWDKHKYTMSAHYVLWYIKLFLSKMPHFVILWEARVFFRFFNFVKNAQFCHFDWEDSGFFLLLQFCKKCLILSFSFSERPVCFFASTILSKMLNFVIFWERKVYFFFYFFNIVKNGPLCHYWKVDFKLWDKHKYTMSAHYVLWYIKLFLSKMPHFVILWEARVFFRFFNFVKNAQFCHFVGGQWIFSLLQFCKKCLILSFSERPVYFFASSVLSKMLNFVFFWEAHGFFDSSILSKMLNFVIFWETRVFFRFFNFVKNAQFCHFVRGPWFCSLLQFCQKCSILSFSERAWYFYTFQYCQKWPILSFFKSGLQIMR